MSNHDHFHYVLWRKTRIAKLEKLFGKEYFKDKKILECGAGNGLIGKVLHEEWGADVVFTEGRKELIPNIRKNNPDASIYCINHEKDWYLGKFDFIVHWGLLYHINEWKRDLHCTVNNLKSGGILSLESEILNLDCVDELKKPEPSGDDQALDGWGTQMTAAAVEDVLNTLGMKFKRFDDTDLNAEFHKYDWVIDNSGSHSKGQRRFWICVKP